MPMLTCTVKLSITRTRAGNRKEYSSNVLYNVTLYDSLLRNFPHRARKIAPVQERLE